MNSSIPKIPFVDLQLQHHSIQSEIEQAMHQVVEQNDFILGQAVTEFEWAFATACGAPHGVGVGSGTEAIALGLQACGIGHGDEVILPANTFASSLMSIIRIGATPVLVDCDRQTALIDLIAAEKAITPRTRALLPTHLYGQMVSPQGLMDLAGIYDLLIFEDAGHAPLGEREGYRAGSVGMAAAFSFYPTKNLGAMGDGGMVVTREASVAQSVRSLRSYGTTRKHHHTDLGTNSRLDTLQAAILNVKLRYLADWNAERYRLAQLYDQMLKPLADQGIVPIENQTGHGHTYHLYVIRITPDCSLDRTTLQTELAAQGIQTAIHYPVPLHLQPMLQSFGYHPQDFPNAEALCQEVLSLPLYPGLTEAEIQRIVGTLTLLTHSPSVIGLRPCY